jgi:hypothetical protein
MALLALLVLVIVGVTPTWAAGEPLPSLAPVVKNALEAAGFTEYAQQWEQHATAELRWLEGAEILQVMGVVRGALQALNKKGKVRSALDDGELPQCLTALLCCHLAALGGKHGCFAAGLLCYNIMWQGPP